MVVFSLASERHPATEVDVFAKAPMAFSGAFERALRKPVAPGLRAPFVGLADLLRLKRKSGRERDRADIVHLRKLRK